MAIHRRNLIASALSAGRYRQRLVKMKTRYSRTLKTEASGTVAREDTL
jgi:hypothetical protein